VRQKNKIKT